MCKLYTQTHNVGVVKPCFQEFSPYPLLLTFYCLLSFIGVSFLPKVVFITALFYLLCYSEEDYLPVKWVTDLLPNITAGTTEDYGKAFSRAIRYQSCDL